MLKSRLCFALLALTFLLGVSAATAWAGERSSKSQKSCKSARSAKSAKSYKSCRSDKSEKSQKSSKSGKSGKSDKSGKSGKSNKSGKCRKSTKSLKSGKTEKSTRPGASESPGAAPGKVLVCHVTQVIVMPMGVWHLARVIEVPEPAAAAMLARGDHLAEPGLAVGQFCAWWD